METYQFKLRVASDGVLRLELPVGVADADVEVLVVVQPPPATSKKLTEVRAQFARGYEPWTEQEEEELCLMHAAGQPIDVIAAKLQRQPGAIRSRLQKIERRQA